MRCRVQLLLLAGLVFAALLVYDFSGWRDISMPLPRSREGDIWGTPPNPRPDGALGAVGPTDAIATTDDAVRFAVVGDFGVGGNDAAAVADLIRSWNPDFIVTTGDNNYPRGEASTIDRNIGQYYHDFIYPYTGGYGPGATENRFFPSLGNHDWQTESARPYLEYFALPGNERYYDFVRGPVHLYALDSDRHEPDGVTGESAQGRWLQAALTSSEACWKLVYFHHPPYSSGEHGSHEWMQWPFPSWGASAVLAGHDHVYERIVRDGFPYFVNGLGGNSRYSFKSRVAGSEVRFNDEFGAMRVTANRESITYEFITVDEKVVDRFSQTGDCPAAAPVAQSDATATGGPPISANATPVSATPWPKAGAMLPGDSTDRNGAMAEASAGNVAWDNLAQMAIAGIAVVGVSVAILGVGRLRRR